MAQSLDWGKELEEVVVLRGQEDKATTSTAGKDEVVTTRLVEEAMSGGLSMLEMVTNIAGGGEVVTRHEEEARSNGLGMLGVVTSTAGRGGVVTTKWVEEALPDRLDRLVMVTRNNPGGERAQNMTATMVGENNGSQGGNQAEDYIVLAESVLPILQKEEINLEARGTQYWLGALDLMGKEEERQQNIVTRLREALVDREEFKIKLVADLDENESTMEMLLRKMMKEEESMAEWRVMRGQAQKQLEQEEANEICSDILADMMVGMFATINEVPVDQGTKSNTVIFGSKDVRDKNIGPAGVDTLPPKGDHKDPPEKVGEHKGLPRQVVTGMSTAGKTDDREVRQGEPLASGPKVSVRNQIPFKTGLEANSYMVTLEREVVALMQAKGDDMYQVEWRNKEVDETDE
jgi:hypothetical protein